ncbi:hypothetical protein [Actinoplanes xinjiangensis]|uniref:Uncharacterized protein n=1 Tax=Actinoplanes xinjiangensis TaxID=512350 RepID=A0A316FNA3_9ACTN|nr:hypothetical protein [Actinoplanes xinjiangensis]PWK50361.1 hypothetical protein BC793_103243 [Actinoplanes xinjiangensis]GIF36248.1 hypothetical protein Axi01nite_05590 [Actinoplanes xinjiangensis]
MTITPRGNATTRTARNRIRRRQNQNAAGEPRHAAPGQPELAPPRRRGGRHAADEPVPDDTTAAADTDVAFPAPAWNPWATSTRQALPAGSTGPLGDPGVVDRRSLWAAPEDERHRGGRNAWAENTPATGWAEPAGGDFTPLSDWTDHTGVNVVPHGIRDDGAVPAGGWTDHTGVNVLPYGIRDDGAVPAGGWTDHIGPNARADDAWAGGTGTAGGWGDPAGGTGGWADTSERRAEIGSAGSGPSGAAGADAVDAYVDELWRALDDGEPDDEEASCADGGGRGSYRRRGVKDRRKAGRRHIGRWSHARRTRSGYLNAAMVRCGLYLGALSVAIAAAEPLGRVAWPVPAVMVLLGWTAAQGLTSIGVTVTGRGGPAAAARTVGAGFAAVVGLWCALVWIAPDALLGPNRLLAATAGVGGLVTLATVTAALVTRAEGVIAGWYVPCWLLAAAVMADAAGVPEAAAVPVQTLLPAAMVAVAVRAFRPALLPASATRTRRPASAAGDPRVSAAPVRGQRAVSAGTRPGRFTAADRRRAFAYLIIGAAQAVSVVLLWRGGPAVMPLPAALPLLLAVPLLEGLIGWHTDRLNAGLDSAETPEEFDRHVRNVTAITLAGLLPPLVAGCALLVAAYRLPYGFSAVPGAREAVLALAAATLLGGVFAVTFLLAARTRHGIAATLAAIPPLAAAVLAVAAPPAGLLPAAVAVLAATHLAGLLIVALTAADLRRTP